MNLTADSVLTDVRDNVPELRSESVVGTTFHSPGESRTGIRLTEQPWHQHAARYAAIGMEPSDIAEACEVHVNTIYALQKTPWFQERVCSIMLEQDYDIMEFFKRSAMGAAIRLKDLSENAKSETVKLAANAELLDRHFGKAVAKHEVNAVTRSEDPTKEVEALEAQIRAKGGVPV